MLRLTGVRDARTRADAGRLRGLIVSIACLLRSAPMFFRAAPRTPLRVLCIVALDTVQVLRCGQPLSRQARREVAAFLDFQACTNAVWDRKPLCAAEYEALRQQLEKAGLGVRTAEYLDRIRELETERPPVGGDLRRFDDVRSYRESVARLSLAAVAATALDADCLEDSLRSTYRDPDMAAMFGMAMQCQIIDDVLDYREDLAAGLPSFLTASRSLPQAIALTAETVRSYAMSPAHSSGRGVFPLDAALLVLTAVTKLVVAAAGTGVVHHLLAGRRRRP